MENKEEIIKALQIIQRTCKAHPECLRCPFETNDGCGLENQAPEDWKIEKETDAWRAFR